jgi:hypothetical protein
MADSAQGPVAMDARASDGVLLLSAFRKVADALSLWTCS